MRVPYVAVEMASEDGLSTIVAHGRPVDNALGSLSSTTELRSVISSSVRAGRTSRSPPPIASCSTTSRGRPLSPCTRSPSRPISVFPRAHRHRGGGSGGDSAETSTTGSDPRSPRSPSAPRLPSARLQNDPDRGPAEALSSIASEAQSAVIEVRRIVQDLRPPALDELGLVGAIRARADHFGEHLIIDVAAPDRLDDLPAAIESVAYRIVSEALTNVVRHSGASHAWVDIEERPQSVVIEVADDGLGVGAGDPVGVGLASMHERAGELGGTCNIGRAPRVAPSCTWSCQCIGRSRAWSVVREHPSADRRRPSCVPKRPALPPQRARRHRSGRRSRERPPWRRARG